jgi:hypothetical protein
LKNEILEEKLKMKDEEDIEIEKMRNEWLVEYDQGESSDEESQEDSENDNNEKDEEEKKDEDIEMELEDSEFNQQKVSI